MIIVSKNSNKISISGHAFYDDFGKDIVCSSVSSIVITTINGIEKINENYITYNQSEDLLEIIILDNNEIVIKLIENMMELLKELGEKYPLNVRVN